MRKRILYLDILKTVAIILVCSYHFQIGRSLSFESVNYHGNYLEKTISALPLIGVPIFFMCNGALLLNKDIKLSKHYSLVLKLLFQMILFWVLTSFLYIGIKNSSYDLTTSAFINLFFLSPIKGMNMTVFWFMFELISIYLILPFIKIVFDNISKLNIRKILLLLFTIFIISNIYVIQRRVSVFAPLFKNIDLSSITLLVPIKLRTLSMIVYFLVGGLIHKYFFIDSNFYKPRVNVLLSIVFCLLLVFNMRIWYFMSGSGYSYDIVYDNYFTIVGMCLSVIFYVLIVNVCGSVKYHSYKLLDLISSSTINIYYLHWIIGILFTPTIITVYISIFNRDLNYFDDIFKGILIVLVITYSRVLIGVLKKNAHVFKKWFVKSIVLGI